MRSENQKGRKKDLWRLEGTRERESKKKIAASLLGSQKEAN